MNTMDKPARIFSLAMPAGLDVFFAESGERVKVFNAPIPPATEEEFFRTVFWAERLGIELFIPGTPPPVFPPLENVISSINGEGRQKFEGPFGEEHVSLLTPEEAGNITGATAFCGPGAPGRPGGTVDYSYFSLPSERNNSPTLVTSENIEVYYTLGGRLSFKFEDTIVMVPALT